MVRKTKDGLTELQDGDGYPSPRSTPPTMEELTTMMHGLANDLKLWVHTIREQMPTDHDKCELYIIMKQFSVLKPILDDAFFELITEMEELAETSEHLRKRFGSVQGPEFIKFVKDVKKLPSVKKQKLLKFGKEIFQ